MRTLCAIFVVLCAGWTSAETYKVSQLKYENFKAYDQYDINTDSIRTVLLSFSKKNPTFEQSGLFQLAAELANIYREKGLVFHRVEVVRGNPTRLVLVPGVMSAIDVRGNTRYRSSQIDLFFDDLFGDLVDNARLSEAMTRMNSLPGLQGLSFLSFGARPGDAVLNVNINQESWGQLTTRLNNYGTPSTGEHRLSSQLTLNNPLKWTEQWRMGGTVSESTENWSGNLAVDFHRRGTHVIGLSGQYQRLALTEDFELLSMSGWQATADVSFKATPVQGFSKTFSWQAKAGYLQQSLQNDANITFFDIAIQEVPGQLGIQGDFAGNTTYLGYQLDTKGGYLLDYQSSVALDDAYWLATNAEMSLAQSITGGALQRGIDLKNKLQVQYALTPLPSHRRFSLSGPTKLGAYPVGSQTADTAVFNDTKLALFNVNWGWLQTVLHGVGQVGWGQTQNDSTDLLTSLGAQLEVNIGALNSEIAWYTDSAFEKNTLWFEVTLNWPKGK